MRVGLCFDGFYSIHEMIELARLADEIGMESIWMSDHLCFRDSLTTCMALLAATKKIKVAPAPMSPYARADRFGDVGGDPGRVCAGAGDCEPRHRQRRRAERSRHRIAASAPDHARICRDSPPPAEG